MAPKFVTFRRHDHLVSVLFGDLLSHSYNIIFSMFLYLVAIDLSPLNFFFFSIKCTAKHLQNYSHTLPNVQRGQQ